MVAPSEACQTGWFGRGPVAAGSQSAADMAVSSGGDLCMYTPHAAAGQREVGADTMVKHWAGSVGKAAGGCELVAALQLYCSAEHQWCYLASPLMTAGGASGLLALTVPAAIMSACCCFLLVCGSFPYQSVVCLHHCNDHLV